MVTPSAQPANYSELIRLIIAQCGALTGGYFLALGIGLLVPSESGVPNIGALLLMLAAIPFCYFMLSYLFSKMLKITNGGRISLAIAPGIVGSMVVFLGAADSYSNASLLQTLVGVLVVVIVLSAGSWFVVNVLRIPAMQKVGLVVAGTVLWVILFRAVSSALGS